MVFPQQLKCSMSSIELLSASLRGNSQRAGRMTRSCTIRIFFQPVSGFWKPILDNIALVFQPHPSAGSHKTHFRSHFNNLNQFLTFYFKLITLVVASSLSLIEASDYDGLFFFLFSLKLQICSWILVTSLFCSSRLRKGWNLFLLQRILSASFAKRGPPTWVVCLHRGMKKQMEALIWRYIGNRLCL